MKLSSNTKDFIEDVSLIILIIFASMASMYLIFKNFTSIGWFLLTIHIISAFILSVIQMKEEYSSQNYNLQKSKNNENVQVANSPFAFFEIKYMLSFPVAPFFIITSLVFDVYIDWSRNKRLSGPPRSVPVRCC